MRVLLDTNIFLWCIAGERSRLSKVAAKTIADENTELLLSAVSLWEIALKVSAGKIELPLEWQFFHQHMTLLGIAEVLPVQASHVFGLFGLPEHHRDPFDRLIVAQCLTEKLPLLASDTALKQYPIEVIW